MNRRSMISILYRSTFSFSSSRYKEIQELLANPFQALELARA